MLGICNYRTMEAKARQVISENYPECMFGRKAVPVEQLAEKVFGLSIEYQRLTKNGDKVLGKLICKDGLTPFYDTESNEYAFLRVRANTILVEAKLLEKGQEGRLRFTIAHELAHWILHREIIMQSNREAAFNESTCDNKIEAQADYMASALLMPLGGVKRFFYSVSGKSTQNDAVSMTAEHFGVSKQAMSIRLKSHNIII